MSDEWDAEAAAWDDDPFARAYARAAMDSLQAALDERAVDLAGAVVCDFGCGTGLLTERLIRVVGSIDAVDTSRAMLEVLDAKIATNDWTNVRTGTDIPTSQGGHDLVVCSSVCSFLDDYPGTVQRLAELLRPGGVFVQWDWEQEEEKGGGEDAHGLTRSAIRRALTSAELIDVHVDTAFEADVDGHVMRPLIGIGQRDSGEHVSTDVVPEPGRQGE